MPPIKAVLFDLDGTLVNREAGAKNWLQHQFQTFADSTNFPAFYSDFIALDARGHASKLDTFAALADKWTWPHTPENIWADYRQNVWRFCELFPDAFPALEGLRSSDLKTAILTNGTVECQNAKIEALRLSPLFNAVLISEQESIKKPAPELFWRACERLNVPPSACLMVGDSLKADVRGALDAGLQAAFLNRDCQETSAPTRTITSLSELSDLLNNQVRDSRMARSNI